MTHVADRLRATREEFGLTQRGMDELLGVSRGRWQKLEQRGTLPKAALLNRLSELGISAEWLFSGRGAMWRWPGHKLLHEARAALAAYEGVHPIPSEILAERWDLQRIQEDLRACSADAGLEPARRAEADALLASAFGDESAHARLRARQENVLSSGVGAGVDAHLAGFDRELMEAAITVVLEIMAELGQKPAPAKLARLMTELYIVDLRQRAEGKGPLKPADVIRLVRAA